MSAFSGPNIPVSILFQVPSIQILLSEETEFHVSTKQWINYTFYWLLISSFLGRMWESKRFRIHSYL